MANYEKVLTMMASSIMNKSVIAQRNPLLFRIASQSIGDFVRRHSADSDVHGDFARRLRIAVDGKIDF